MPFQGFPVGGYAHIVMNGQSLSIGGNSYVPITGVLTDIVDDVYMIGNTPGSYKGDLTQLKSATFSGSSNSGESPIVNAAYSLKTMINRTAFQNVKIIASSVGVGGAPIETLMKGTGNYNNFLTLLDSVKSSVLEENVVCPAIAWMQGEYNQGSSASTTKDEYKEKITQLKNDMQADIMSKYGQKDKPLFFVYQPSRLFTPKFPIVAQALFEFAQENSDVILMNPHYFCPISDGGHLTANGYRWYGEYIAKAIFEAIFYNNRYKAIQPKNITINQSEVVIELSVPYLPIKVDIELIKEQINYGFALYKGEEEILVLSTKVYPSGIIVLTASIDLNNETDIYLEYAGQKTNGVGNIRDSDEYVAFSNFMNSEEVYTPENSSYPSFDPTRYILNEKSYQNIFDKPYPMYNWLNTFRIKIK